MVLIVKKSIAPYLLTYAYVVRLQATPRRDENGAESFRGKTEIEGKYGNRNGILQKRKQI